MAMPIRKDLTLYKGQTYDQNIYFANKKTHDPLDLEGLTAKAQVRPSLNSPTLTVEMYCTVFGDEGKVNMALDADETAPLIPGFYEWDLQMTDSWDRVIYSIQGKFIITGRVTV